MGKTACFLWKQAVLLFVWGAGGPVCRPYENTKTCPVNDVGADDLGGPRASQCAAPTSLIRHAMRATFP